MKRFNITDSLQVVAAILITTGVVAASPMPKATPIPIKPASVTKQVAPIQKVTTSVAATVAPEVAPVEMPKSPEPPAVTWQDNPNHCDQNNQYIAATAPFVCINKPIAAPVVEMPAAAAPVAQARVSTGGCVSGYATGDYYLDKIITYESTGNSCATNPGGCFGLLQACPGAPLREACGGDPACQIEWFQANKTGGRTWEQVWQHELVYGWW